MVTALLILYCGVSVPLEIAFEPAMRHSFGQGGWVGWSAWNLFVDALFVFDILLNFRTSFLHEGHMVRDGWLIAHNYLRGWFFIDLIGSFPLTVVLDLVDGGADGDTTAATRLNRQLRACSRREPTREHHTRQMDHSITWTPCDARPPLCISIAIPILLESRALAQDCYESSN